MTIIINFGKWAGFYRTHNRICLGWVAITVYFFDFDDVIGPALDKYEKEKKS